MNNTDLFLGGVIGAGMLNRDAEARAQKQAYEARVNAFIMQGMTYPQAVAFTNDTYMQEKAAAGPQAPSIWIVIVALIWTGIWGTGILSGFAISTACGFFYLVPTLLGIWVLHRQRLMLLRRRAWKKGPKSITSLVAIGPSKPGSA